VQTCNIIPRKSILCRGVKQLPEGPELRHSRDVLRSILVGKFINRLHVSQRGRYAAKVPAGFYEVVKDLPLKINSIDVKGKFMWWTLQGATSSWYLWSTYGMSGQWSRTASNNVCFIAEFNGSGHIFDKDQQKLFFNDQRHFGTIKFVSNEKIHQKKLASIGPDILEDAPMDPELFAKRILLKPQRTISEALMDQSCVSGVGNYLRAEILYDCKMDPWRNVSEITNEEYVRLCKATVKISKDSYKSQGASIKAYRNVDGSQGATQFNFKAYGCETCPSGHEITRKQDGNGRTMHWCTLCQR